MNDKKSMNKKMEESNKEQGSIVQEQKVGRRDLIKNMLGISACVVTSSGLTNSINAHAEEDADATELPPQEGDYLVHAEGEREGKPVDINELEVNKKYITAWPMDPESGVIRNGRRTNKVLAIKLDPSEIDEKTKAHSEDGIAVYSGVCTHEGCDISAWVEAKKNFFCYCHYSRFDPRKFGKVTYGPANKRLPMLAIDVEETTIKVAGNFTRKPGGKKRK